MTSPLLPIGQLSIDSYELAFLRSPIILVDGIASFQGGYMPIIELTEFLNVLDIIKNVVTTGSPLKDMYGVFQVQGGTTLLQYANGEYPFQNVATAVNYQIKLPNQIVFEMLTPFKKFGDPFNQLPIMTVLIQALERHRAMGGYYMLLTPSKIYTSCLLNAITQVDYESDKQLQMAWMWAFTEPLLTEEAAEKAYSDIMDKIAGKLPDSTSNFFSSLF